MKKVCRLATKAPPPKGFHYECRNYTGPMPYTYMGDKPYKCKRCGEGVIGNRAGCQHWQKRTFWQKHFTDHYVEEKVLACSILLTILFMVGDLIWHAVME